MKRSDLKVGDHVLVSDHVDWMAWSDVQRHVVVRLAVERSGYRRHLPAGDRRELAPGDPGYGVAPVHTRRLEDDGGPHQFGEKITPLRNIKGPWEELKARFDEHRASEREINERAEQERRAREREAAGLTERLFRALGRSPRPYEGPYSSQRDRFALSRADVATLLDRLDELAGEGRVHQDRT